MSRQANSLSFSAVGLVDKGAAIISRYFSFGRILALSYCRGKYGLTYVTVVWVESCCLGTKLKYFHNFNNLFQWGQEII